MPVIQASQIDGLIKTTQPHIVRERKASIAQLITKYVAFRQLFRKHRMNITDGTSIQWNINTEFAGTATQVGLFDTISPSTSLHQIQATIPWRHTRVHASWDLREIAMNRSPARILNYVKEKIFEMDGNEAEHIESQFWGTPAAGDDQSIFGVQYYVYSIVDAGGSATGDFASTGNGAQINLNLAAFASGPAGVSRVTYSRSGNWHQVYSNTNYDGLVTNIRQNMDNSDYESPVDFAELKNGGVDKMICCRMSTKRDLEDTARAQNDKIGPDLAYYDGKAMIRSTPIVGVPHLDKIDAARATPVYPVYVFDWSQLYAVALEGFNPYEVTESGGSNQPMVVTRARYRTWNLKCCNAKYQQLHTTS